MNRIPMKIMCVCLLIISVNILSQWQPDYRLTNHPDSSLTSPNNARCIAASGNVIHTAWYDNRDGNYEIYYKRSTDDGATWGAELRLTNDNAVSQRPSVAVSGQFVHVVWYDFRNNNEEIYYKQSTNGGVSWGSDTRLTNNFNVSILPSVSASGSNVNVVWCDTRDGNYEVYYKRSADNGANWGADTRLTSNASISLQASCVTLGSFVHVVWNDNRDGSDEIYYKRSADNGLSWGTDTRLTSNAGVSWFASVDASASSVQVAWVEQSDGNPEIYCKRSTDSGLTWEANLRLTNNAAISIRPTVSVSGSIVHLVWQDNVDGNDELYYKYSTNGGINYSADTRLTNNTAFSVYPCHTISASGVHLIWREFRDGNWEVYYKRNPTGNLVNIHINSEILRNYKLDQNYPNPFNPETKIKLGLPKSGIVMLNIYDASGKVVSELVNQQLNAGTFVVTWNASEYSSGVYFYKLETEGFVESRKMILIK
jgi:hypothetical protein